MNIQKHISLRRVIAFVLSALIPLAAIGLGIMLVVAGAVFNVAFVLTFILLPLSALSLLFILLFSGIKVSKKIVFDIIILVLFVILFLFGYIFGKFEMLEHYENEDAVKYYEEVADGLNPLPGVSEIGNPQEIEFYDYFSTQFGIFTCDSDVLVCKYSETDYNIQKEELEKKYIFQNEPMEAHGYVCEQNVQIDDYVFGVLSVNGEYETIYYPKRMILIATNDVSNEIVYMSFYDDDLDYVTSLEDFINEDCGWKRIK